MEKHYSHNKVYVDARTGALLRNISLKKYIFIVLMLLSFISDAFCQVSDKDTVLSKKKII